MKEISTVHRLVVPARLEGSGRRGFELSVLGLGFVLILMLAGTSCSDDDSPSEPDVDPAWSRVATSADGTVGTLAGVAFHGSRGVAVGTMIENGAAVPLILEAPEKLPGVWTQTGHSSSAVALLDVLVQSDGSAIAVGGDLTAEAPVVMEQRTAWNPDVLEKISGRFESVLLQDGGTLWAGGAGASGVLAKRESGNAWEPVEFLSTPNEKGIEELTADGERVYACGWDDGGPPFHFLLSWVEGQWVRIESPRDGASNYLPRAMAVSPGGNLHVGGETTDFSNGQSIYEADYLIRDVIGEWIAVVLPNPEELQSVNDILLASDGTIYLACGRTNAQIVRVSTKGAELQGPGEAGRIQSLAEGPNGEIYAAGFLGAVPDQAFPALFRLSR